MGDILQFTLARSDVPFPKFGEWKKSVVASAGDGLPSLRQLFSILPAKQQQQQQQQQEGEQEEDTKKGWQTINDRLHKSTGK